MISIEKVAPIVVDDVEFYISNDGLTVGISQSALARLCGVPESTMRLFLTSQNNPHKRLESLRGLSLTLADLAGINGAKLIPSHVAVLIIQHFATEKQNKVAQFSLTKFADKGLRGWAQEVSGKVKSGSDNSEVLAAIKELMLGVESIKVEAQKNIKREQVIIQLYPNLQPLHDSMLNTDLQALPPAKDKHPNSDLITCREWLDAEGLTLDHGVLLSFGRAMGNQYRSITGKVAQMKFEKVGKKWVQLGMGYPSQYLHLFELAYQSIQHKIK